MKPHLSTWLDNDFDDYVFTAHVINNGIGPAVIKSFKVLLDGQQIEGKIDKPIVKALEEVFKPHIFSIQSGYMNPGYALGAKEKFLVFSIKFKDKSNLSENHIAAALDRIDLVSDYESFYGEKSVLDSRLEKLKS